MRRGDQSGGHKGCTRREWAAQATTPSSPTPPYALHNTQRTHVRHGVKTHRQASRRDARAKAAEDHTDVIHQNETCVSHPPAAQYNHRRRRRRARQPDTSQREGPGSHQRVRPANRIERGVSQTRAARQSARPSDPSDRHSLRKLRAPLTQAPTGARIVGPHGTRQARRGRDTLSQSTRQ